MDTLTPEKRGLIMSRIRSKNTKPELFVRSLVHKLGYRFRLHKRDLPGTPDLTFTSKRKVIFVNGCFWHGHECKKDNMPKSRVEYWQNRICTNKDRDKKNYQLLHKSGWDYLIIWECEVKDREKLINKLKTFLD